MDGEEKVKSGLIEKGALKNKVEGIKIGFLMTLKASEGSSCF